MLTLILCWFQIPLLWHWDQGQVPVPGFGDQRSENQQVSWNFFSIVNFSGNGDKLNLIRVSSFWKIINEASVTSLFRQQTLSVNPIMCRRLLFSKLRPTFFITFSDRSIPILFQREWELWPDKDQNHGKSFFKCRHGFVTTYAVVRVLTLIYPCYENVWHYDQYCSALTNDINTD